MTPASEVKRLADEWVMLPKRATRAILRAMQKATWLTDSSALEMERRYNGAIEAACRMRKKPIDSNAQAVETLRELVALKKLKDEFMGIYMNCPEHKDQMRAATLEGEYNRRKPLAWAAAFKVAE